jgi:hypothetical protein
MSTFRITKPGNFKNYSFGERLIDIVTALSLPTPFIRGSEMTKFHKKGVWVIHITQPGREIEPKTENIKFKTFHTSKKMGAHLLMQELIARLCGRHFSELQNHYSHLYGRRDEKGMAIVLPDDEQDPMRIHLAELGGVCLGFFQLSTEKIQQTETNVPTASALATEPFSAPAHFIP